MTATAPDPRVFRRVAVLAGAGLAFAATATERTPADWLALMDNAFRELDYDGVFSYYTEESAQHASVLDSSPPPPPQQAASRPPPPQQAASRPAPPQQAASRPRPPQQAASTAGPVLFSTHVRTTARLATFRVVHKVVDGVPHERIVYLNGPRREILRTGDQVACVLPSGERLLALEGALPSGLYGRVFARDFAGVGQHYDVKFSNRDRVAGRAAVGLEVTPRDADRFGYRLWLDAETGLLLRSELRDANGAKLEIFVFSTLRIGDRVAAADLQPSTDGDLVWHRLVEPGEPQGTDASQVAWRTRWIPPGFNMTGADSFQPQPRGDGDRPVRTLRFSDGLAAFSVFIEPMPADGAGSIVSRAGATVALTHRTTSAHGDHLVTVIGEVPVATARRIAAGVAQRP